MSETHPADRSAGDARPVLVGYDGSVNSEKAVFWAADVARATERKLRILTSYSLPMLVGVGATAGYLAPVLTSQEVHEIDVKHRELLETVARRVKETHPGLEIETFLDQGAPGPSLLKASDDVSMIVLGTRGVGSAQGLLMGSVSYAVAHRAKRPVMLVPESSDRAEAGRVVVGVDGSSRSSAAADWALALARCLHRPLEIVTAWHYPYQAAIPEAEMMMGPDVEELRLAVLRDAKDLVRRERTRLQGGHGVHIETDVLEGSAADSLAEFAGPRDIVVVASKSHSLLAAVLLGSTAVGVAHRSRGPVVIVHGS